MYHDDGVSWAPVSAPIVQGFDGSTLPIVALTADAAENVWYSFTTTTIDYSPPPGQWRYRDDVYAYRHRTWTYESLPITNGEVVEMTTDGNGGTWAIMATVNPLGSAILYTSGSTWSIYGKS